MTASRKVRYGILIISYLIGLSVRFVESNANIVLWGLSGLIFAIWTFDSVYYLRFGRKTLTKVTMFVPVGIGLVSATLVSEVISFTVNPEVRRFGLSPHLIVVSIALICALVLFHQLHQKAIQSEPQTVA